QRELNRYLTVDGHQLFAEQHRVPVVFERLTVGLPFHLRGTIERRLDAAELLDQFDRTLVSDSWSTRNVVDGIAAQSHHIDHLLRRHSQYLDHFLAIQDEVIFHRVEHLHLAGN